MNLGIFIENIGDPDVGTQAVRTANKAMTIPTFQDVSIFYEDVGKQSEKASCGLFNSTDLPFFKGNLIVTFMDGLQFAINNVADNKIFYYFGLETKPDLFGLLSALNNTNVSVIAKDVKSFEYIQKKTARKPIGICGNMQEILTLMDDNDE